MIQVKNASTLVVVFRAYLASDHVTVATGKTIVITISKNGGAFGNPNAGATNATEMSSGFYKVTLDTTDTGTDGPLAVRGAVATVDDVGVLYYVGSTPADVVKLLGTAWLAPGTAGTPDVNVKLWNALTTVALPLVPTTAGRTLDVSAGGEGGVDWANVGSPTTTVGLSGTTVKTATDLAALIAIRTGTAQLGGATTITLDAGASAVDNVYAGEWIWIQSGTGPGQARLISSYVGATKVATVPAWITAPDVTSVFVIVPAAAISAVTTVGSVTGAVGSVTGAVGSVTGAVGSVTGAVGSVTGAVGSVTGAVGSVAAGGISAASFAAGAIDASAIAANAIGASELATDAVTEITDAILALTIETGLTLKNALRVIAAAAAGKLSGAATATVVIRNAAADDKDRMTATVDASGNRSAITLDLT